MPSPERSLSTSVSSITLELMSSDGAWVFGTEATHPHTSPGLTANLICRVLFAVLGNILCWIPFRLLARNGEFAAIVLVIDVMVMNLFSIVNALTWSNDNWETWWDGVGLCDLEVFLAVPMQTIYAACIFVIIRNLAQRVRLLRVGDLTRRERTRKRLFQALVIFTIPMIQLVFAWFILAQRYIIATLVGCSATFDDSWPRLLVITLPAAMFSFATIPYAFLTWKRFRAISHTTKEALSSNSTAQSRAARTRRRLYQMTLSILVPYVPLQMAFLALNVGGTAWHPYDYSWIHGTSPYPWNSILFVPSWMVPFEIMNQPWITILTTIPIVLFFGLTKEAVDMYRQYAVKIGLGRIFPALREAYDPDRTRRASANDSSQQTWFTSKSRKPSMAEDSRASSAATYHLPNAHHQAIVSSAGPSIPPRHSSSTLRPPEIPDRQSSLHRGFLKRIPLPARLPSLLTLRSGRSTKQSFSARSRDGSRSLGSKMGSRNASESEGTEMLSLDPIAGGGTPTTPAKPPSLFLPSSTDGREAVPRDMFSVEDSK